MKAVKKQEHGNVLVPFSSRPTKKYSFATPIRPCSIVLWKKKPRGYRGSGVGQKFRVGYYSWQDGLDCIWLVNDKAEYERTIDHDFLEQYFEIVELSKERSLYGKGRQPFSSKGSNHLSAPSDNRKK